MGKTSQRSCGTGKERSKETTKEEKTGRRIATSGVPSQEQEK